MDKSRSVYRMACPHYGEQRFAVTMMICHSIIIDIFT